MTVVPLFCARFITIDPGHESPAEMDADRAIDASAVKKRKIRIFRIVVDNFNLAFRRMESWYTRKVGEALEHAGMVVSVICACVLLSFVLYPFIGKAFFPRTDPGQFVVNVKVPAGTRIEVTDDYISKMEQDIRSVVSPQDLNMIVSNIGITPDLSAIYTSNSGMNTAFIQVSLKEDHKTGSYTYMQRVREKLAAGFPDVATYFQAGGLVDSVVNQGKPAPIDIQIGGNNLRQAYDLARATAAKLRKLDSVNDVLIPQDLDYPGLELNIDRVRAGLLGVTPKDVVDNVITALTSDGMIAPSFWVDPKTGNSYMLTVQYPEAQIKTMTDFRQIPLRSPDGLNTTPLQSVADIKEINTPTEVDHYQLRRVFDIYVMPKNEDLSQVNKQVESIVGQMQPPAGVTVKVRGTVRDMESSFSSFGIGLILAVVLVYLILMAQFASFSDPFIILLAIPPALSGALAFLFITGSTLNIMSLMGIVMTTGIAVSNSILIVEFTSTLRKRGRELKEALIEACKARLRPILMTSLATILGMIPMALALEPGSEQYAPLARAILGGLTVSVTVTVFLVPAAYLLIHRKDAQSASTGEVQA
jgi:multidrug efflux pump subunit AcrB